MNTLTTLAAHYGPGAHEGPGPWWPVFPLIWLTAILAVIFIVSAARRRRWEDCGPQSGRSRLAERFATGEIDEDEYRNRLAVLDERRRGRRGRDLS